MAASSQSSTDAAFPKGVSQPAIRALAIVGVTRLDEAARFSERELLRLHGMGPKAIRIMREALHAEGKSFAGER